MNSEKLDSWRPSGEERTTNTRPRDPWVKKIDTSRRKNPPKTRLWDPSKTLLISRSDQNFPRPTFLAFFGLRARPDLYCDLHNTIDQVLTVLPSLTVKRKIYADLKQNWLVTSINWKLGECVRQWFHWTIHVIFLQTRLNLKTEAKHRY